VINLAVALHQESNQSVIAAELRPGQGTISLDLGFNNPLGLINLLQMKAEDISRQQVEAALVEHDSGIHLLLSSYQPSDSQFLLAIPQFNKIVKQLAHLADFTVLDLGPSLPPQSEKALEVCDQIFVVVEPETNAVAHTKALLDDLSLRVLGLDRINVVVFNRFRSDLKLSKSQIQDQLGHAAPYIFTPALDVAIRSAQSKTPMILAEGEESNAQHQNNLQQLMAIAQAITAHGQKVNS
jgi:MinD-like ATPase involved in chromosome partitioning or flagellar assembly